MNNQPKKLTAVLCQTHPHLKKKSQNLYRFLQKLQFLCVQDNIDIIIFPQMSFTGYNFKDYADVLPQAVIYGQGIQFIQASKLAIRLNSYVLFGYVEKCLQNGKTILYNSAAIIDRQGKPKFNTRKTHLYFADQLWAKEGAGFKTFDLINKDNQIIKCTVGICMDINQKHFTSNKHELADFVKANNSEVVLFPTNWIDNDPKDDSTAKYIYSYWIQRLLPKKNFYNGKQILLLVADRVGAQYSFYDKKQASFIGSSVALTINPNTLIDNLNKKQQNFVKVQCFIPN